ncbi:MAG: hypothetical protein R2705_17475 [Ilumatobacteraceae bacterium]
MARLDVADRDQLGVHRRQVGDEAVQVGGVTDPAAEPGDPGLVVVHGEVVHERNEQVTGDSPSQHDLVGGCFGHAVTITPDRVKVLHLIGGSPR